MRRALVWLVLFWIARCATAHITPNVELVKRGEFLKGNLPGAARFFEKQLMISGQEGAAMRRATGWSPSEEDTKVYVGRNEKGDLAGTVVFLWLSSAHGPVGLAVAFGADGAVRRVAVTDVASEPLAWVRPLIEAGGMQAFSGLGPGVPPDPSRVAPAVNAPMSRYYAQVIAQGVVRAQRVERVASQESAR